SSPSQLPFSQQHGWLRRVLRVATVIALSRPELIGGEATLVARSIAFLADLDESDALADEEGQRSLHEASLRHPAVRQQYFWILVEHLRESDKEPDHWVDILPFRDALRPEMQD